MVPGCHELGQTTLRRELDFHCSSAPIYSVPRKAGVSITSDKVISMGRGEPASL